MNRNHPYPDDIIQTLYAYLEVEAPEHVNKTELILEEIWEGSKIRTHEELTKLPPGAVIIDVDKNCWMKNDLNDDNNIWWKTGSELPDHTIDIQLPAHVVYSGF